MKSRPYFNFEKTLDTLKIYQQLGAKNIELTLASDPQFADLPTEMRPADPASFVMNASFEMFGNRIYCSDTWADEPINHAHSSLCFDFDVNNREEVEQAKELFSKAEQIGCEITMPLGETEWTSQFGMFKDPVGLTWILNGVW